MHPIFRQISMLENLDGVAPSVLAALLRRTKKKPLHPPLSRERGRGLRGRPQQVRQRQYVVGSGPAGFGTAWSKAALRSVSQPFGCNIVAGMSV